MTKQLSGVVKSTKMTNTATVVVSRLKEHRKYHKRTQIDKSYLAQNEIGAKTGDQVIIEETRPLSAHKNYKITKIIAL